MYQPVVETGDETGRRNLRRLFLLRNIIIPGIALGILLATGVFKLSLPLRPLVIITGLLATLNILTWRRLKSGVRIRDAELFGQMLLDVAGLTGVFYFTGGASNPFVWFYLLPLMIAATILPRAYTWVMAGLTIICYSGLYFFNLPLPHQHLQPTGGFQMHVFGMWLGFVISAGVVAVIIVGMAHSLRERDRKLAEAREQALQNEQLVALGTLAAGAAHELGTPLGTMAILTTELEQEYAGETHTDLQHKLGILSQQISRCKEALSVISSTAGASRAEAGHCMPVKAYLKALVAEWQTQRPDASLNYQPDGQAADADLIAERTLTQALINILNNAADASPQDVQLEASWTRAELTIEISDRGPGLDDDVVRQLGKLPVSTKPEGMGVGLYLACATIQRLGGSMTISNRKHGGTVSRIILPLLTTSRAAS